jgi:hypothetical protein
VLVPTASNTVNFAISGPGAIVGVDNGNAPSTESYKGSSRKAFNGKCLAIVQSSGASGTITLTASSSGLTSGTVSITAQGGISPTSTPITPPTATPTPTTGGNLALGKPATASSAESANPAANGNDGNTLTRWCAANGNTGNWWQVDLGAPTSLSGSEVVWEFDGRNYRYRVEVSSDGSTWTTVVDKTTSTSTAQVQTDAFSATSRYVRITVTGLPSSPTTWASFFEFRVFGASQPTSTPTATPVGATSTPTQAATATTTPVRPTDTPTQAPTSTAVVPTATPGSGGCSPVTGTITAPFSYDGAGTFCWQIASVPSYINSWNLTSLKINGVDFSNIYVSASSLPPKINGYWYISYSGAYAWSHIEVK